MDDLTTPHAPARVRLRLANAMMDRDGTVFAIRITYQPETVALLGFREMPLLVVRSESIRR